MADPNPYPNFGEQTAAGPAEPGPAENDSEESVGNSALLPKKFFSGSVEPGQTVTLKVVHVYDDEVEVSTSSEAPPEGDTGDTEEESTEPEDMSADEEIDSMASATPMKGM